MFYRGSYILDVSAHARPARVDDEQPHPPTPPRPPPPHEQGVYDTLLSQHGLASAATVVVSGCSAGGLAVFLHVDHLAAKVRAANPGARVLGAPGAGFFLGEAAP